jgi:hypothetical protein
VNEQAWAKAGNAHPQLSGWALPKVSERRSPCGHAAPRSLRGRAGSTPILHRQISRLKGEGRARHCLAASGLVWGTWLRTRSRAAAYVNSHEARGRVSVGDGPGAALRDKKDEHRHRTSLCKGSSGQSPSSRAGSTWAAPGPSGRLLQAQGSSGPMGVPRVDTNASK